MDKEKLLILDALQFYVRHKALSEDERNNASRTLKEMKSERVKPDLECCGRCIDGVDECIQQRDPNQNALDFETGLKKLLEVQMQQGLTVTEAVGTLHLCAADIANQFLNGQKAHEFFNPKS